jgi:hypothetical protein
MSEDFSIHECQRVAKDADAYDSATFDLVGPGGRMKCQWLDAYMGLFRAEGNSGFLMVRDVPEHLRCKNFAVPAKD